MNNYQIRNTQLKSDIRQYKLSNILPNCNHNADYGVYEFYLNNPHELPKDTPINVRTNTGIDIHTGAKIMLRRPILFGIAMAGGGNVVKFWNYADELDEEWHYIDGQNYLRMNKDYPQGWYQDTIEIDTNKNEFTKYRIDYRVQGGFAQVKEYHAMEWQDLVPSNYILTCGIWSGLTVAYSIAVKDTYFRINDNINLCEDINILYRGYDDLSKKYIWSTDYGYNYDTKIFEKYLTPSDGCHYYCITANNVNDNYNRKYLKDYNENIFAYTPPPPNPNPDNIYGGVPSPPTEELSSQITQCGVYINFLEKCPEDKITTEFWFSRGEGATVTPQGGGGGGITNIAVTNGGHDYIYPFIVITDEHGMGYSGKPKISGGRLTSVETLSQGDGYTNPSASVNDVEYEDITNISVCYNISCLEFWQDLRSFKIDIGLERIFNINLNRSDYFNKFVEIEKEKQITKIYDNERYYFEPWVKVGTEYKKVNHIQYQLFFKTEEDQWGYEHQGKYYPTKLSELGFNDNDVKYERNRLKKSFLRASVYNDENPTNYLLEYYFTTFVNAYKLHTDLIQKINNTSGIGDDLLLPPKEEAEGYKRGFDFVFDIYNPLTETITRFKDDKTLITYKNSDGAEGYGLSLYGEEFKDNIPTPLWIKYEFNNANDGKRTLFFNDKSDSGVEMDNIFFDGSGHKAYIWTKIWVNRYDIHKNGNMVNIWFPDDVSLSDKDAQVYYGEDDNGIKTLTIKLYEQNVI